MVFGGCGPRRAGGGRRPGLGPPSHASYSPFTIRRRLIEPNLVDAVPLRGVGEDDRVALAQALDHLDVVDRGAAELDVGACGLASVGADAEERDGRLPAAARR